MAKTKDDAIREVAANLDVIMDDLRANVAALNDILTRPQDHGGENDERLARP